MTITAFALVGCAHAGNPGPTLTGELRTRCYGVLTDATANASQWVRVHAAEALVSLNHPAPALAAFRPLAETTEPRYRVVVWRVLAAAEPDAAQRRMYVQRIRTALLDPGGPDQTHAMEALAKLREPAAGDAERRCIHEIADGAGPTSPFALWRLWQAGDTGAVDRLVKLLSDGDATTRARAAYVLGRLQPLPTTAGTAVSMALMKEPSDSPAHSMLRSAIGGQAVRDLARDPHADPSGRYIAATWLAEFGNTGDDELLTPLLHDPHQGVQVGAAFALLHIDQRAASTAGPTWNQN
jgi:SSS family solute:Na+ symporter